MARRQCNFTEETYQTGNKPVVDRDAGVIRHAKILGRTSKNNGGNRIYSDKALSEAAKLYEGIGVNTDHPGSDAPNKNRSVRDALGWIENVKVEADGVYGDLHVLREHELAGVLFETAERNPSRLGLSHNAYGEAVNRRGKRIVESVSQVRSVDLVQNPATVNSLFESEDPMPLSKKFKLKNLIETLDAKSNDRKCLTKLIEMDGMPMDMESTPVDVPVESAESAPTADEAARSAFKAAINAILDDDALTWEDTKKKISEMVSTLAKMAGGDPMAETPAEESSEEVPVPESLQEQFNQLKAKLADKEATETVRNLLESKGIAIKPSRIAALKATGDKKVQAELIEDWKRADGPAQKAQVQRPAYSKPVPLTESRDGSNDYPKDSKAFLRQIGAKPKS